MKAESEKTQSEKTESESASDVNPYLPQESMCTDCLVYPRVGRRLLGETNCSLCHNLEWADESEEIVRMQMNLTRNIWRLPEKERWELVRRNRKSKCKDHPLPRIIDSLHGGKCTVCENWWMKQKSVFDTCQNLTPDTEVWNFSREDELDELNENVDKQEEVFVSRCLKTKGHLYSTDCEDCNSV